ncbi:uncharacterized protein PG998_002238 [Apiospora kogelbergensis]|uniref:uncharacterized protein n=1 Tax=Apiospora kogelbergensis TaxID=1337665 RepID=UPI00313008C3
MGGPTMTFGTSTTPTKQPLNGFFTNGQWLCNCQPRLPTIQFQVRRKTKNEGRWFYTCQKERTKPGHCGFFLFAEDARLREEGALLTNSNTEPSATQTPSRRLKQTTLSASVTPRPQSERRVGSTPITSVSDLGRQVGVPVAGASNSGGLAPPSSSATVRASDKSDGTVGQVETNSELESSEDELSQATPSIAATAAKSRNQLTQTGAKRKRPAFELDEDDLFGDWDSDEERLVTLITDSTSTRGTEGHGRKRDAFATPGVSRTVKDTGTGMATPSLTDKPVRRVLFAEPEIQSTSKRQRTDESGSFTRPAAMTPSSSQESATTPGSHAGDLNVTETVMGLLKGQSLDDQVRGEVRRALQKFESRAKGLERGRDASRQAGKRLQERITKQQARIVDLENK